MKPSLKVAVVAGGYIVALLLASAAVAIRGATTSGPDAQAASGMYAFGDALLFVAVFGGCALVPTGAALFFLRPYRHFWTVLSALGLAVAVTGVTAAILFAVGRRALPSSLATWADFSVLRILVAPLLAFTFLCAQSSPHRSLGSRFSRQPRWAAVSAYGGLWLVPLFFQGPWRIRGHRTSPASDCSHDPILLGRAPRPGRRTWRAALCGEPLPAYPAYNAATFSTGRSRNLKTKRML
jgi:hypothetical protein